MIKKIFTCIPIFLNAVCSFAITYYVSPSGNNASNGLSQSNAFLTLQHASNLVIPGDSVIILPGTYSGFYHTTSGNALHPIVFHAMAGVLVNTPNGTTNDGINLEGASYIIIEGFKVYGVPRAGIRSVINDHVIIRNNIADSCGVWGILTGFSENILIEGNVCSHSVDQHGIYFGNSADNPVIRGNTCFGNHDCGIHMNGDISLGGDGIISNAMVENNLLFDNGTGGGSAINCDGVQNSIIQNNIAYNNHASGISLYQIDGGGGAAGNVIVNNTILQPSDGRWALNISDNSNNNTVFNNIFYSAHSFRGSISIDVASLVGFKSNYNILTDRMSNDGGNSNMTLSQWNQSTQQDMASLIAAPAVLFINPASHNYHLINSSPAIDLGRMNFYTLAAPAFDADQVIRPQGIYPDAGALEYVGATGIPENSFGAEGGNEIKDDEKITLFDINGKVIYSGYKKQLLPSVFPANGLYIICTSGFKKIKRVTYVCYSE